MLIFMTKFTSFPFSLSLFFLIIYFLCQPLNDFKNRINIDFCNFFLEMYNIFFLYTFKKQYWRKHQIFCIKMGDWLWRQTSSGEAFLLVVLIEYNKQLECECHLNKRGGVTLSIWWFWIFLSLRNGTFY